MTEHQRYMKMALRLAAKGLGFTSPNPVVGAVIVKNGRLIAKGYHKKAGMPHAEVEALRRAGVQAKGATMYVTLEPCNHFGRTPPCSEAIMRAGIKELYYALPDPNPHVSGGGAEALARHGVEVHKGPLEEEARYLNRFYLHSLQTGRPYVIAKFAASMDGKIATFAGESQWITGPVARQEAHKLRLIVDAIAVGSGTARADDPRLTARRNGRVLKRPLRIVLDSFGRLPLHLAVFIPENSAHTILAATSAIPRERLRRFEQKGVQVVKFRQDGNGRVSLPHLIDYLGQHGINSLLVEGGSALLGSFVNQRLIDEVHVFLAPLLIGGRAAPGAVGGQGFEHLQEALRLRTPQIKRLDNDLLFSAQVEKEEI